MEKFPHSSVKTSKIKFFLLNLHLRHALLSCQNVLRKLESTKLVGVFFENEDRRLKSSVFVIEKTMGHFRTTSLRVFIVCVFKKISVKMSRN